MFHRFRVEQIDDYAIREKVFIDDVPIRCSGYVLKHNVNEVPVLSISIPVIPNINEKANVEIENLEEIARFMDEDTFKEFCETWKEVHG